MQPLQKETTVNNSQKLPFRSLVGADGLQEFQGVVQSLPAPIYVSVDCETSGLNNRVDRLVGISACVCDAAGMHYALYLPMGHRKIEAEPNIAPTVVVNAIKNLIYNNDVRIVMHNSPFDVGFIEAGLKIDLSRVFIWDTLYLNNLLFPYRNAEGQSHSLKQLSKEYLDINQPTFEETFMGISVDMLSAEKCAEYAQYDAYSTLQLFQFLLRKIDLFSDRQVIHDYYRNIEMPNFRALLELNANGVPFDLKKALEDESKYGKRRGEEADAVFCTVGKRFDLESSLQVKRVFFSSYGAYRLKPSSRTEQEGDVSFARADLIWLLLVNENDLKELPFKANTVKWAFEHILKYRYLSQYLGKLAGFLDQADVSLVTRSGSKPCRLYGTWRATTMNGRVSCTKPSLLGMPKRTGLRGLIKPIAGKVLVGGDFNQIDLRCLATYLDVDPVIKDSQLVDAFRNEEDLHWTTTKRMYPRYFESLCDTAGQLIPPEKVAKYSDENGHWEARLTKNAGSGTVIIHPDHQSTLIEAEAKRGEMKRVNFGLIYGMSAKRLAEYINADAEVDNDDIRKILWSDNEQIPWDQLLQRAKDDYYSVEKAKDTLDRFFEIYPKVSDLIEKVEDEWSVSGRINNLFGRPLSTPIFTRDDLLRAGNLVTVLFRSASGPVKISYQSTSSPSDKLHGKMLKVYKMTLPSGCDIEEWSEYRAETCLFTEAVNGRHTWRCEPEFEEDLALIADHVIGLPYIQLPHSKVLAVKVPIKNSNFSRWIKYPGIRRGERQIFSNLIGSTSTDMCRMAMILMREACERQFKESERPKLILCVHDELLYEVNVKIADDVETLLKKVMSFERSIWESHNVYSPLLERFTCPMKANVKHGDNYGQIK